MSLFADVNAKIKGRVALLSEAEAELLCKVVAIPGDYVDLGTLWGGTAILAALAKQVAGVPGKVYTIDFMRGGYWETGDPSAGNQKPSEATIYKNLALFGVDGQVDVVKAESHPWPLDENVKPTAVLIDCDHKYEGCLLDWKKVRSLKPQYVAFHDYNHKTHPGVAKVVDEVANSDELYKLVEQVGTLVVFEYQEPEPQESEEAEEAVTDWSGLTMAELREELLELNLPVRGKKSELVERLEEVYA